MMNEGIRRITPGMPQYPAILKEIKDPPGELYCLGDIAILNSRCLAVVGSRKTTSYGRSTAVKLAKAAAEAGLTVVSGMARGIDTCAHRGALDAGGSTIAVLGCGVDVCYPAENRELKEQIERCGLVISEYPPGMAPQRYHFPQRNRIISGLSEVTAVVQAGSSSGALITAELAAEQGREVCAVPGNIDSQYNLGNNKLIKDGVFPVTNVRDVLELMGADAVGRNEAERILSDAELTIYSMLEEHGEMTVDEICRILSKPPSYVAGIITVMEMKGVVFFELGKIFIAKG